MGGASVIGKASSSVTQADIAGILQHGNATGSTLMHITQLQDIARNPRYKNSQTIQDWLKVLNIKMHHELRGHASLALLTSLSATALKAVSQLAFKLCFAKPLVLVHWRAFHRRQRTRMVTGSACGYWSSLCDFQARRRASRVNTRWFD